MNLSKPILILSILLFATCVKHRPTHVWIYEEENVSMLNGNVKEVFISKDSLGIHEYKDICFDEEGNILQFNQRRLAFTETGGVADTLISTSKTNFEVHPAETGSPRTIVGFYSLIDSETSGNKKTVTRGKSKWGFDKREDTVKYFGDAGYSTQPTELYKYDQKGDMIESTEDYREEFPTDIFKYVYDVRHLLREKTLSEPDDGRTELLIETCFQYKTFDSAGNWIKRI